MILDPGRLPNDNKSPFAGTGRKIELVDEMGAGGGGRSRRASVKPSGSFFASPEQRSFVQGNSPVGSILLSDFNLDLFWFCRCRFR